jgi:dTDP-4-dehydrorhamnose 3,5-epimerase
MTVERTDIEGLLVVRWPTHGDERGFFRQTYQIAEIAEALGREPVLRQGNHSRSAPGVLRGFHAEPWDKLVYVVRGRALAAIADIRPDSPTFGRRGRSSSARSRRGADPRVHLPGACELLLHPGRRADRLPLRRQRLLAGGRRQAVRRLGRPGSRPWTGRSTDPVLSEADQANPTLRELFPDHPRFAG